ncbi:hypothetical protein [Pseudomonas viridiflava]|uniref:hypothetical protein n=1 Tax=Pseudomonas viridiflava TaxID=33069 RepID=UPI0010C10E43|nr:hypothetical protein [Pseudomonas viridiflava]
MVTESGPLTLHVTCKYPFLNFRFLAAHQLRCALLPTSTHVAVSEKSVTGVSGSRGRFDRHFGELLARQAMSFLLRRERIDTFVCFRLAFHRASSPQG